MEDGERLIEAAAAFTLLKVRIYFPALLYFLTFFHFVLALKISPKPSSFTIICILPHPLLQIYPPALSCLPFIAAEILLFSIPDSWAASDIVKYVLILLPRVSYCDNLVPRSLFLWIARFSRKGTRSTFLSVPYRHINPPLLTCLSFKTALIPLSESESETAAAFILK